MTENRPAPLEVTVHLAGRDGKIKGNPLPIANPGHQQETALVSQRMSEVPDFDQAEHDRLFQKRMVNGVPHWTAPHQLTARQILATHRLEDDDVIPRSEVYRNKMADLIVPKYTQLPSHMQEEYNEEQRLNAGTKFGAGTGAGLDDNITSHGYDWTKPVLTSTQGVHPKHSNGMVRPPVPRLSNGGHRVMWMFTHHPDVPIPLETDVHRFGMGDVQHLMTLNTAVTKGARPEDVEKVTASEERMDSEKASDWRDSMAKAYPDKYGSGKP
jgi:hypothetical protein